MHIPPWLWFRNSNLTRGRVTDLVLGKHLEGAGINIDGCGGPFLTGSIRDRTCNPCVNAT